MADYSFVWGVFLVKLLAVVTGLLHYSNEYSFVSLIYKSCSGSFNAEEPAIAAP